MRNDVYRLMTLAVACNLSCDEAYEILQQSFIDRFTKAYDSIPDTSPDKPTVLDALISYTMQELPIITNRDTNIVYELRAKRREIVDTFIKQDLPTMITRLARRNVILENIRSFLRSENKINSMYAMLNSTRVDSVFVLFLEVFRENCAHAFQFDGSFIKFVMNCFQEYFYKGHNRDIWAMIREVDITKREVEQSIVVEKTLTVQRTDDLLVHDLLLNISLVNDLMFRHPGQSDDAYGIQYDIYYLILCELCKAEIKRINAELGEDLLVFVDPMDRRDGSIGLPYNKGIGSKISNAQAMIPYIFEYVRSGKLNTRNLADLRDKCFTLGKADNEGRNCIWEDVVDGGETSRYLDNPKSAWNYDCFDQVLKGVISVYTLMTEMEERGLPLVDHYDFDLFQDKDVLRYMDYLSSIPCVPLIRQLQKEPVDYTRYSKDLLEFDGMVDTYAGSSVNRHANIRENRYYAITYGFLVKPKIKHSDLPTSQYDILTAVSRALEAVPHSYREYIRSKDEHGQQRYRNQQWVPLEAVDIVDGHYKELYYNAFFVNDMDKATYYLLGTKEHPAAELMDSLSWNVGMCQYEAIEFAKSFGMYVPLERGFFFYGFDNKDDPFVASMEEVKQVFTQSIVGGVPTQPVYLLCCQLQPLGILRSFWNSMKRSVGFPWEIGLSNIGQADVQGRLDKMPLYGQTRKYIQLYYQWLDENSRLEHSFIDMLKAMFTEAVYLSSGAHIVSVGREQEVQYAKALLPGLMSGDFEHKSLSWILDKLHNVQVLETANWANNNFEYRQMDRTLLAYLYGEVRPDATGKNQSKVYLDLLDAISGGSDPAEKFVLAYNHIYTKLVFLRYLRDSFTLIVDSTHNDASTLVCELNQQFNVTAFWTDYRQLPVDYGIYVNTMGYEFVRSEIYHARYMCMSHFHSFIEELVKYVRECEDELAKLIAYNVVTQDNSSSRFEELGRAFKYLPYYTGIVELDTLRRRATTDAAGFFLMQGSYFKGHNGENSYYIHRSGRMVTESQGKLQPVKISPETDEKLYRDILRRGLEALG